MTLDWFMNAQLNTRNQWPVNLLKILRAWFMIVLVYYQIYMLLIRKYSDSMSHIAIIMKVIPKNLNYIFYDIRIELKSLEIKKQK